MSEIERHEPAFPLAGNTSSGQIIMCQGSGFWQCPYGSRAVVTLLCPGGAALACCDACARFIYNNGPDLYRIAPLSHWRDPYEEAKAALGLPPPAPQQPHPSAPGEQRPEEVASLPPQLEQSPGTGQRAKLPTEAGPRTENPGQASSARSHVRALLVFGGGTLLSWIIAIILGAKAMNMDPANGYPEGSADGWLVAALLFAALPFLPLICFFVYWFWGEIRRYRQWIASLSPEERTAVYLAEATATAAVAWKAREHRRQVDAQLTSSVMGYTMPDGVTPRPTDQLRAMEEQQMRRDILQAQHDALARRDQTGWQ